MEDNNFIICSKCIKDKKIIKFLENNQYKRHRRTCSICNSKIGCYKIDDEDESFYNFFRAIIRYHYSELDYNRHWGGTDYLINLFKLPNNIFNTLVNSKNDLVFESFIFNVKIPNTITELV